MTEQEAASVCDLPDEPAGVGAEAALIDVVGVAGYGFAGLAEFFLALPQRFKWQVQTLALLFDQAPDGIFLPDRFALREPVAEGVALAAGSATS